MSHQFSLNKVQFYQLDNLIKNRVPFILINLGPSLTELYTSIYKLHLEQYEWLSTENKVIHELEEKKIPLTAAILLICYDGQSSLKLSAELEKKSYTNVYVVDGGYQQLMTER